VPATPEPDGPQLLPERGDPAYVEVAGPVAELVLNRPDRLNAIDAATLDVIDRAVAFADSQREIRVLIVRGAGRAFCTGADLGEAGNRVADPAALTAFLQRWHRVFTRLAESPVPSIAAVQGYALAGGFELLQACDLAVVADDAVLADQHARYGLIPAGGGTQRLPRLIGQRRAAWLMLSGEPITPAEARQAGLVNAVCPAAEVLGRAREMAALLASRSPVGSAAVKQAIRLGLAAPSPAEGMQIEQRLAVAHMASKDAAIGLAAFATRTVPQFVGE
jgi:enoyl-CoA hydratase/carnithine racemase